MANGCGVRGWRRLAALLLAGVGLAACSFAQELRYYGYRDVDVPDYATVRIGPFYSTLTFSQSVGMRYTRYTGPGAELVLDGQRGRIRDEGIEYPFVTRIDFRNYLIASRHVDLDLSFRASYAFFPMGTQENEFSFEAVAPGVTIDYGAFRFRVTSEQWYGTYSGETVSAYAGDDRVAVAADLDMQVRLTEYLRMRVYDRPSYRVEWVDPRGMLDPYTGERYRYFQNIFGVNVDWLMARDKNAIFSASRTDTLPQSDDFGEQRSVTYQAAVGYEQELTTLTVAGVRWNYSTWLYPESERADSFWTSLSTYIRSQVTKYSRVGGEIGYGYGKVEDPGPFEEGDEYWSVIGSAFLTTDLRRDTTHTLQYSQGVRGGYRAGQELFRRYAYDIRYTRPKYSIGYNTAYYVVEPQLTTISGYTDWRHRFTFFFPVTRYISATLSTSYEIRDSDEGSIVPAYEGEPVLESDYQTWATTLSSSFQVTKSISASAYVEHVERFSDDASAEFARDSVGANLTYRHEL